MVIALLIFGSAVVSYITAFCITGLLITLALNISKGGVSMFLFGLIVGVVAVLAIGFGVFKRSYRLVPRKGGGYVMESVPAYSVKVIKTDLDSEKE